MRSNFISKSLKANLNKELNKVENPNAIISLPDFAKILLSLTLTGLSIRFFHIEETLRLPELMNVVIPGFIIYAFLPLKFRMPFSWSLAASIPVNPLDRLPIRNKVFSVTGSPDCMSLTPKRCWK